MNRHTSEMLHDMAAHEMFRRWEVLAVVAATIVVLHGILYHLAL